MAEIQVFRNKLIEAGIVDPEGVHHEFVSGVHGQKIDFDAIPDNSALFYQWVDVVAQQAEEKFPKKRYPRGVVLLSVAGGTNRLVGPVADQSSNNFTAALTTKVSPKAVELTADAKEMILEASPSLVVAVEDVGTAGTTSATAVAATRALIPEGSHTKVAALNTWQRSETLPKLDEIQADYSAIIYEPMVAYPPEVCREVGFCAAGWTYIPHD